MMVRSSNPGTGARGGAEKVSLGHPVCTVIVPVYNHWPLVPDLLKCLQTQIVSQDDFEVILVDNGSTEFTPPESMAPNVRILHCETPGSYAARNVGVVAARGDWLAFTDADCRPAPQWLAALLERSRQSEGSVLLAGSVEMYTESAQPNAYEIYDLVRGIPQEHYVRRRGYAATANLLAPKAVVEKLGMFDATRYSGGDADLCQRARELGYPLVYVSEAVVYHPARQEWSALRSKAHRIKGGQILSSRWQDRTYWIIRTLLPPFVQYYRFLMSSNFSFRYRLIALSIQTELWISEVLEMFRLMLQGSLPKRS